jgi:pyruvate dehydrogenase E2 component (dihydrolipoamide acetyltransferase)
MVGMTMQHMRLPDLGEGLTEAVIVRWLVEEGDTVTVDQVVAEVETAKATVELPAPFAGVVAERHAGEGDEVAVGATMLTLRADDGAATEEPASHDTAASAGGTGSSVDGAGSSVDGAGADGKRAPEEEEGRKLLVGLGPLEPRRRRRRAQTQGHQTSARPARPHAKPPVRKLAKDLGVDLATITGSGPDGRITRDDVHAAAAAPAAPAAQPDHGIAVADDVQRIPVTGVRARIADRLSVAWREIPAAACWVECDASALMALRDELAAAHPDVRLTPLALVLRCCVVALRAVPRLNAGFDAEAREIVQHDAVHLGVAVQTDRGLVVPVIRDAGERSVLDLARAVQDMATQARDDKLPPAQMMGGTFTVSNFGAFGVDGGTPIINHPQAAILGVGRITPRPWVVGDRIEVRQVVQLSVTFDHRVCDGAEAGGFLRRLADLVERPTLLLAH